MFVVVFLNGERKKFCFAKDLLLYVLQNFPKLTFSYIKNLALWLDCYYDSLPFLCETYDFYIIKKE